MPAGSGKSGSSQLKPAPLEFAHPEAVEVEHRQREVTAHAVDELGDICSS